MEKRRVNRISVLLALLLMTALLPVRAQALGLIETQRDVTLTIRFLCDKKAARDVEFKLYRVSDVSPTGEFTMTEDFAGYPVSMEDRSADGWRKLASTLAGYVQRDKLRPLDLGETDREGMLTFPTGREELKPGLYLVLGGSYVSGQYTYTAEPFLVSLPDDNDTGTQWLYDVTVEPKNTIYYDGDSPGSTIRRSVLKVWEDDGNEGSRPWSVTVQLLRDGDVYDTVKLNENNGWSHTWKDLDAGPRWTVVEREIPGYTVSVSREGITFVVTNTIETEEPSPSDEPSPTEKPVETDKPMVPVDKDNTGGAGNTGGSSDPRLPQTGVLWWPVPLLLCAGLLLIIVGCVRGRRDDGE